MKNNLSKISLFVTAMAAFTLSARAVTVTVPGTSDPWLAGMPDGSVASGVDVAPDQSPVLVPGVSISGGVVLKWSATGTVGHPSDPASPDGYLGWILGHDAGSENGISNIIAPIDSLLGVFLSINQPDLVPAPGALDFSSASARDYLSLSPAPQQVFFLGDGLTSSSQQQTIIAPAGATRLFLGTMDGFEWKNNIGSFEVQISPVPEVSSSLILLGGAFGLLVLFDRKAFARS